MRFTKKKKKKKKARKISPDLGPPTHLEWLPFCVCCTRGRDCVSALTSCMCFLHQGAGLCQCIDFLFVFSTPGGWDCVSALTSYLCFLHQGAWLCQCIDFLFMFSAPGGGIVSVHWLPVCFLHQGAGSWRRARMCTTSWRSTASPTCLASLSARGRTSWSASRTRTTGRGWRKPPTRGSGVCPNPRKLFCSVCVWNVHSGP